MTPPGKMLLEAGNLKNAGKDFKEKDYAYHFIESFVPTLTPEVMRQKLNEGHEG